MTRYNACLRHCKPFLTHPPPYTTWHAPGEILYVVLMHIACLIDACNIMSDSHLQVFDVVESELPFCKAVVLETLRMHPSVMKQMKMAVEYDVLPDGTRVRQLQLRHPFGPFLTPFPAHPAPHGPCNMF